MMLEETIGIRGPNPGIHKVKVSLIVLVLFESSWAWILLLDYCQDALSGRLLYVVFPCSILFSSDKLGATRVATSCGMLVVAFLG